MFSKSFFNLFSFDIFLSKHVNVPLSLHLSSLIRNLSIRISFLEGDTHKKEFSFRQLTNYLFDSTTLPFESIDLRRYKNKFVLRSKCSISLFDFFDSDKSGLYWGKKRPTWNLVQKKCCSSYVQDFSCL